MIELIPSPTTPKQCVAPDAIKVSIMISAVVRSGANSSNGCAPMSPEASEPAEGFEARACAAFALALMATILLRSSKGSYAGQDRRAIRPRSMQSMLDHSSRSRTQVEPFDDLLGFALIAGLEDEAPGRLADQRIASPMSDTSGSQSRAGCCACGPHGRRVRPGRAPVGCRAFGSIVIIEPFDGLVSLAGPVHGAIAAARPVPCIE
jgi:hypothetical protein